MLHCTLPPAPSRVLLFLPGPWSRGICFRGAGLGSGLGASDSGASELTLLVGMSCHVVCIAHQDDEGTAALDHLCCWSTAIGLRVNVIQNLVPGLPQLLTMNPML